MRSPWGRKDALEEDAKRSCGTFTRSQVWWRVISHGNVCRGQVGYQAWGLSEPGSVFSPALLSQFSKLSSRFVQLGSPASLLCLRHVLLGRSIGERGGFLAEVGHRNPQNAAVPPHTRATSQPGTSNGSNGEHESRSWDTQPQKLERNTISNNTSIITVAHRAPSRDPVKFSPDLPRQAAVFPQSGREH